MNRFVVIDTNVIISAVIKPFSIPGEIVIKALSGEIIPVLSEQIVDEYREVLSRPKFSFPSGVIETIISELEEHGILIVPESSETVLPDPDDVIFYEVVMEKRKESEAYLVTGNIRHFPKEPFIVTPRELLDIIGKDDGE